VLLLIVICWAAGLDLGLMLGWKFVALGAAYLVLQIAYTLSLKHHVILDVLCVAAGFVLRVLAGAVAISVPVSGWFLPLCSAARALPGLAKRRQELPCRGPPPSTVPRSVNTPRLCSIRCSRPSRDVYPSRTGCTRWHRHRHKASGQIG
jgi:hypothetical protein